MPKRLLWIGLSGAAIALAAVFFFRPSPAGESFVALMRRGNDWLEKGEPRRAAAAYVRALRLSPESVDVRLNLANAYLRAGREGDAIEMCRQVLDLDHDSAAAYYLMGCAYLRQNQPEPAIEAFQQSRTIDPAVTALNFQLGLAEARLDRLDDAIHDFEQVVRFEPNHPSAHYQLSRLYLEAGRGPDATRELEIQRRLLAGKSAPPDDSFSLESCKYTEPLAPFVLAQPADRGVPVRFVDATEAAFGPAARAYRGPIGVIDYDHDGRNSLFVAEGNGGFQLLDNRGGRFRPLGRPLPGRPKSDYRACLIGDLEDSGVEDAVVLGEKDSRLFKFYPGGRIRDVTRGARFRGLKARAGVLADLDFTGNLDLLAVLPDGSGLRVYTNLGSFSFMENTAISGLPSLLPGTEGVEVEDWNNQGLPGIFVARAGQPPLFYAKKRAGRFIATRSTAGWPAGSVVATGDLNNDLHPDAVVAAGDRLVVILSGQEDRLSLPLRGLKVRGLLLTDYDNDGWLDIVAYGENGLRVWRNRGHLGFADVTAELGLDRIASAEAVATADFGGHGATDLVVATPDGLRYWRNEGGAANRQLKLRLAGKRSNASALGVRVDVVAGNWRTSRTVHQLPLEIGVGRHDRIDSIKIHWFDLSTTLVNVAVTGRTLAVEEPTFPSGSCPYLYAWDGRGFRFVTDILGAAPLGLPATETRLIEADPEEFLALGGEREFPLKNGAYEVRMTDELREVLYLDQARLVAVDHPAGTVVVPNSKLRPNGPFPPAELWTLRPVAPLLRATRDDGLDVTAALARVDGRMAAPERLRRPQLRGLAEPFSITMDFGPLPVRRPLVLVLTGWLRFGGGMANIAGAIDPTLPYPFPTLEAERPDGSWQKVMADVGAPCGKTKTILVDLNGKLPAGARRLRLTTAFEIYWDCAALCERVDPSGERVAFLAPSRADLHWRGFSRYAPLPASLPLTPEYDNIVSTPPWDRTPEGWCTRYGDVRELVSGRDDKLAILNGGDELSLSFDPAGLPRVRPGQVRDFYLYVVGWDKDADFHVKRGWEVEPLPFRGMDDQAYGRQPPPPGLDRSWTEKYDTRWVGSTVVDR